MRKIAQDRSKWQSIVKTLHQSAIEHILATHALSLGKRKRNAPQQPAAQELTTTDNNPGPLNITVTQAETNEDNSNSDTYITEPNKKRRKRTINKRVRTDDQIPEHNKRSRTIT